MKKKKYSTPKTRFINLDMEAPLLDTSYVNKDDDKEIPEGGYLAPTHRQFLDDYTELTTEEYYYE